MNDKVILLLISSALMAFVILFNLFFTPKTCWEQYTTEQEAITKCETRP
jgi:hypothetical protein